MMTNTTNLSVRLRTLILLFLLTLVLTSLACNLPFVSQLKKDQPEDLAGALSESGLLFVDEIRYESGIVTIQYDVLPEDSPEVMLTGWLNALAAAAEAHPDASAYVLDTTSAGDPFLEIRADGLDARGFAAGELTPDLFLDRLEIIDQRPLVDKVTSGLLESGVELIEVRKSRSTLLVSYYAAPAANNAEMFEQWWGIFDLLAQQQTIPDRIQIRAVMPDNSAFLVEGDGVDLEAYTLGQITAPEFLSRLTINQETFEDEVSN